jgi:CcmD family protein
MERIFKYTPIALLAMVSLPAFSQEVEMADTMRSEGKIYVIVAIVLIVLAGLIAYLFLLDRKVSKLEKRLDETK